MRPYRQTITPANVDADGLADGNSSAGATVTLDGALTSGGSFTSADGLAHQLNITDAGGDDQTTATYTITGTDANNIAQTEDISGPGVSATVETTKYFRTVTSVAIASPVAGSTVDIGTVDEIVSPMIRLDFRGGNVALNAIVSGTVDYTVQQTVDNLTDTTTYDWLDHDDADLVNATASINGNYIAVPTATRIKFNSYSSGASVKYNISQSDV